MSARRTRVRRSCGSRLCEKVDSSVLFVLQCLFACLISDLCCTLTPFVRSFELSCDATLTIPPASRTSLGEVSLQIHASLGALQLFLCPDACSWDVCLPEPVAKRRNGRCSFDRARETKNWVERVCSALSPSYYSTVQYSFYSPSCRSPSRSVHLSPIPLPAHLLTRRSLSSSLNSFSLSLATDPESRRLPPSY